MNFCDKTTLKFRKQGLSENEIRIKLRKYYFYSKSALVIYSITLILIVLLGRFKTANISVLVVFFLWFVVILRMFLQLRKYTKPLNEI